MKNENKWLMIYVLYLISIVFLIVLDVNCEYDNRMFCMKYRVKYKIILNYGIKWIFFFMR